MEVLRNEQLDAVSGGAMWFAAAALFAYLNLEKLNDSWSGLVDGYNAGFSGADSDPGAMCTP